MFIVDRCCGDSFLLAFAPPPLMFWVYGAKTIGEDLHTGNEKSG